MPEGLAKDIVDILVENALLDVNKINQAMIELIGSEIYEDWDIEER